MKNIEANKPARIFDISDDKFREVTQGDIDLLQKCAVATGMAGRINSVVVEMSREVIAGERSQSDLGKVWGLLVKLGAIPAATKKTADG